MRSHSIFFFLFLFFVLCSSSCSHFSSPENSPTALAGDLGNENELEQKKTSFFKIIWSKNLDTVYDSGNFPISFNSPLIHEGLLFMGSPMGRMVAYNLENGREVWSAFEKGAFVGQAAIYKDQVIYGNEEGRVFSRNYLTGKLKYKIDLGGATEAQAVFYKDRGFFHLRNHKLVCLDAGTGKVLWTYKRSVTYPTTIHGTSRPFPHQQKLFVGFADGYVSALSIEDGSVLWEQNLSTGSKFVDVDLSPLVIDDIVYAASFSGPLTLLKADVGNIHLRFPFTASRPPLLDPQNESLLIGTTKGAVLRMNKNNEIQLERQLVSEGGIVSMALWQKVFVAASMTGKLYFLDPSTLQTLDVFSLGSKFSTVFGPIEVSGNKMAFYTSRNRLYVFEW